MDRVILFLTFLLCAQSGFSQDTDWRGGWDFSQDPWRGIPVENKKKFGTMLDDGANNGKISFACDALSDKRVAGYRIHYGTASGTYTMTHDCKKTLESVCTISGLTNSTTYYFVVVAYGLNPAITSGYSDEVSGTP